MGKGKGSLLTDKQEKFCQEYIIDLNGTQAAIRAGYSKKTAEVQASVLLRNPKVQTKIQELRKAVADDLKIDFKWITERFKSISDRCMQAEPVMVFDPVEKAMVQATTTNSEGKEVGVYTFDSSGANKATENLAKHFGWYETDNKQKVTQVNVGFDE